jgi:hypothetical protein
LKGLKRLTINKKKIGSGIVFLFATLSILWIVKSMNHKAGASTLKILTTAIPESTDPLKYDAFVHHLVFRSVYSSLVTEYSSQGLIGDLATHWKSTNNFKDWEFTLDPDRKFSNGDSVTSDIVLKSFKRVALIQKKLSSQMALFKDLLDIEKLDDLRADIKGFESKNGKITFHFKSPQENLLRQISFGTYGIVHPKDYDEVTGEWKNPHKVIASGPYQLDEMNESQTSLSLISQSKPGISDSFRRIIFFHKSPDDIGDLDLIYGSSESLVVDDRFYFSSPINSTIRYVVCGNWENAESPFHNIEIRKSLRSKFYDFLNSKGLKVTRSFFPLAISGVQELPPYKSKVDLERALHGKQITFLKINSPKKSKSNSSRYSYVEGFNEFTQSIALETGAKLTSEEDAELLKKNRFYTYDLSMNFTGILIEDPRFDVRFMFFSSEGIHLPDADGRIYNELKSEKFDIQKINDLLWEQAIVWPVNHLALGLWVRKDSEVNLENLNLALPPVDFRFVKQK